MRNWNRYLATNFPVSWGWRDGSTCCKAGELPAHHSSDCGTHVFTAETHHARKSISHEFRFGGSHCILANKQMCIERLRLCMCFYLNNELCYLTHRPRLICPLRPSIFYFWFFFPANQDFPAPNGKEIWKLKFNSLIFRYNFTEHEIRFELNKDYDSRPNRMEGAFLDVDLFN